MPKVKLLLCILLIVILVTLSFPLLGCKEFSLSVIDPQDGFTTTTPTVEVRGYVSDPKATVWVNDARVTLTRTRKGEGYYTTEYALTEGDNVIKVIAIRGNKNMTRTITVTYTPSE